MSSVVLASLNSARKKARNARRASDFNQIRLALELYFDDKGKYPSGGNDTCGGTWNAAFQTALSPYLSSLPVDPLNKVSGGNCAVPPFAYYAFYNPLTWNLGGSCISGMIVLYNPVVEEGVVKDECGAGFNTVIFKK